MRGAQTMACHSEDNTGGFIIEESCPYLAAYLGSRLISWLCRAVGARFGRRMIVVGGGQDADGHREQGDGDATMIA